MCSICFYRYFIYIYATTTDSYNARKHLCYQKIFEMIFTKQFLYVKHVLHTKIFKFVARKWKGFGFYRFNLYSNIFFCCFVFFFSSLFLIFILQFYRIIVYMVFWFLFLFHLFVKVFHFYMCSFIFLILFKFLVGFLYLLKENKDKIMQIIFIVLYFYKKFPVQISELWSVLYCFHCSF